MRTIRAVDLCYGSVCSGIEAATVAWHPLGWKPAWFAETERFPSAVLGHRFPEVPNLGDFTKIGPDAPPIDVLVGGTPCQSFSVAGLRGGLADERGNLALEYLRLAGRLRPRWLVWENVSGVLSSGGGDDFACFIHGLAELGYGWAYRVLDAQYFGVPQRRRRVFVVGHLAGWQRAAAVLFERYGLQGHPAPSAEARQEVAGCLGGGAGSRGWAPDTDRMTFVPDISRCVSTRGGGRLDPEMEQFIVGTLGANGRAASGGSSRSYVAHPLGQRMRGEDEMALQNYQPTVAGVRRLTPVECERLQGFPDDWTMVPYRGKPAADGPRYRAIGNSMAVPVMRWIGERIAAVEAVNVGTAKAICAEVLR